jgi:hypothetical protein
VRAHTHAHTALSSSLSPPSPLSLTLTPSLSPSPSPSLSTSLFPRLHAHAHTHERKYLSDFCEASQGEIEHDARVVKSREAWDNLSKDECGYPMDMEDAHPPPRTIEHQTRETLSQFNYE